MSFSTGLLLIAALFVVGVVWVIWLQSSRKASLEKRLRTEPNFTPAQLHATETWAVAVDEGRGEVCIVTLESQALHRFAFEKIVAAEIAEDGATVTKTNRGSQLVGAAIGSVFGPAGAIIGGLSGSTTAHSKVSTIELKLYVDDLRSPVHRLPFLESSSPMDRKGVFAKLAFDSAHHWHGVFRAIVHRAS